ncbi:MAG: aspartate aminotransferase family protein [Thiotrichaceae bacterium]|nr:aspartate aminotransferase family protein [Thiotrichaceae bacterium]
MANNIMATYSPLPVTFAKGEGAYLWDTEDRQYLDAIAGIAVCSIGHAQPELAEAIYDQAKQLLHTSNLYHIGLQQELANQLCALATMDEVFFSNSGTEANEAAIKLARRYAHQKGIKNPKIIVAKGSFHGRTLAALSATGNQAIQKGFEPLVEGFVHVDYNDIDAIKQQLDNEKSIVAIMLEPVQGEGGVNIPEADYLQQVRALCDQHECLMILDEIQTGLCRTGEWFAFQHSNIVPDVMTLAKALGNGVPIGACLTTGRGAGVLTAGTHGSTFGGNPLACRAALTVIDVMKKSDLKNQANIIGDLITNGFRKNLVDIEEIVDIRNKGMMIGIELEENCPGLVKIALESQLLINVTAGKVIRLLPPLILSTEQAETIVQQLSELIKSFIKK